MTGEITLRGRVLPSGGLKEKSVAAHRNKISDVIIPFGNSRDVEDLPEDVRASVRFHPVKTMDEVVRLASEQSCLPICPAFLADSEGPVLALPGDPAHDIPESRVGGSSRFVLRDGRFVSAGSPAPPRS